MPQVVIKHAEVIDVVGKPVRVDDFFFVPALFDFSENSTRFGFRLDDFIARKGILPDELGLPDFDGSVWVRARIPRLFGITPLLCANNCQPLLNLPFLAVHQQGNRFQAYPFICAVGFDARDTLQESPIVGMYFHKKGPDNALKTQIADTFWGLLFKQPRDLEPFNDYYFSEGSGVAVGFDGKVFFAESVVDDDGCDERQEDDVLFLFREMRWCQDCDGSGIEDEWPFLDDCCTCGGTGIVSW